MPWIAGIVAYDAVRERVERLGLGGVLDELGQILTGFDLRVFEAWNANGGAALREQLDARFRAKSWIPEERGTGDIDWIKRVVVNGVTVAVGVEIQVSGRGGGSHLSDVSHLRAGIAEEGDARIDVGVMVVPTDHLAYFLTDRVEGLLRVQRYVAQMRAEDLPILLIAIHHDGTGDPLPKREKKTRSEERPKKRRS